MIFFTDRFCTVVGAANFSFQTAKQMAWPDTSRPFLPLVAGDGIQCGGFARGVPEQHHRDDRFSAAVGQYFHTAVVGHLCGLQERDPKTPGDGTDEGSGSGIRG